MNFFNPMVRWAICVAHCVISLEHAASKAWHLGPTWSAGFTVAVVISALLIEGPELASQFTEAMHQADNAFRRMIEKIKTWFFSRH